MIGTDKYEEFENAMNEGRIERVHCLWALAEVERLQNRNDFLEEIVALLQEQGVDIEQEGFPRWE